MFQLNSKTLSYSCNIYHSSLLVCFIFTGSSLSNVAESTRPYLSPYSVAIAKASASCSRVIFILAWMWPHTCLDIFDVPFFKKQFQVWPHQKQRYQLVTAVPSGNITIRRPADQIRDGCVERDVGRLSESSPAASILSITASENEYGFN